MSGGLRSPIQQEKLKDLIAKIDALCKEYDVSLSHEDWQGSFLFSSGYDEDFMSWFREAYDPSATKLDWYRKQHTQTATHEQYVQWYKKELHRKLNA